MKAVMALILGCGVLAVCCAGTVVDSKAKNTKTIRSVALVSM
jgi:hypothetical protein